VRPLLDQIGHDTSDADNREHQRQRVEEAKQEGLKPAIAESVVEQSVHPHGLQ